MKRTMKDPYDAVRICNEFLASADLEQGDMVWRYRYVTGSLGDFDYLDQRPRFTNGQYFFGSRNRGFELFIVKRVVYGQTRRDLLRGRVVVKLPEIHGESLLTGREEQLLQYEYEKRRLSIHPLVRLAEVETPGRLEVRRAGPISKCTKAEAVSYLEMLRTVQVSEQSRLDEESRRREQEDAAQREIEDRYSEEGFMRLLAHVRGQREYDG